MRIYIKIVCQATMHARLSSPMQQLTKTLVTHGVINATPPKSI